MNARSYRLARRILYGAVIPMLSRSGPLSEPALRLMRSMVQYSAFASKMESPISIDGLTVHHDVSRPSFAIRALAYGSYEPLVVQALEARLRPGMIVLDVGAHFGFHTLLAARAVRPGGHVWAFEPDPDTVRFLRKNVDANGAGDVVTIVPAAVGSFTGKAGFRRATYDTGSSTIIGESPANGDIVVNVMTLDTWAAANGWPNIDLIKMDIEGSEPDAIAGMRKLVHECPRMTLIAECNQEALERGRDSGMRLFDRLSELGFDSIEVLADYRKSYLVGQQGGPRQVLRQSQWYPTNLYCSRSALTGSSAEMDPNGTIR